MLVTETSADPETVALLQAHAAEVTELVRRGMEAMRESMMRERGHPPGAPPA